jgi:hypothetical protein
MNMRHGEPALQVGLPKGLAKLAYSSTAYLLQNLNGFAVPLRSIPARAGHFWVYKYLFAKQDRANIEDDELAGFPRLVKAYAGLTTQQVNQLLRNRNRMEICK